MWLIAFIALLNIFLTVTPMKIGVACGEMIGLSTPCQGWPDDPQRKKAPVGLPTGAIDEFLWDRDTAMLVDHCVVSHTP